MRIVALDPGGTTGWAKWIPTDVLTSMTGNASWDVGQLSSPDHHRELYMFIQDQSPDVLVWERFEYQRRQLDKGVQLVLDSREYIGVAKLYCQSNPFCESVPQPPNIGKPFWSDAKLKQLNLWKTNAPHAMDAVRHLLYYVTFTLKDDRFVQMLRSS